MRASGEEGGAVIAGAGAACGVASAVLSTGGTEIGAGVVVEGAGPVGCVTSGMRRGDVAFGVGIGIPDDVSGVLSGTTGSVTGGVGEGRISGPDVGWGCARSGSIRKSRSSGGVSGTASCPCAGATSKQNSKANCANRAILMTFLTQQQIGSSIFWR